MERSVNVETKCLFVGEFPTENQLPVATGRSSVCRAQKVEYVGTFTDYWPGDLGTVQFQVLLRDNRIVTVRGHAIQYLPNPSTASDVASYGVLGRTAGKEVLIALFPASEVTGIFSGGLEPARASA
jgi:hypothetical protein